MLDINGTGKHVKGRLLKQRDDSRPRLRVLLTNGRFPVSIDLARQLHQARHIVYTVDPMEYHVCKFSWAVKRSRQVPAPHVDPKGYVNGVKEVIKAWKIDLVVPMHEEILFLAQCDEQDIKSRLLAPPFGLLVRLHNKWEFTKLMTRIGLDMPEAHLCRSIEDVRNLDLSREWALKPVYGRASTNVYHLKPGEPIPEDLKDRVKEEDHYIAQAWTKGKRFCSFSVCRNGKLQAHAVYPVMDTIDGSSSVYFEQCQHPGIKDYVTKMVGRLPDMQGMFALDFVETDSRLVTMECNPRSTSGVHLFSDTPMLAYALTDTLTDADVNEDGYTEPHLTRFGRTPRAMVAPGMLMWEHKKASPKQFLAHMRRLMSTKDVIWKTGDLMPSLMQPFLLATYYQICRERQLELPEMFQWDVTWEPTGEELEGVRRLIEEENGKDERAPWGSEASESDSTLVH